jgi:hypothetical protein
MTLKSGKNELFVRFAPCVRGTGLITILSQVAGRAMNGEGLSVLSAGKRFADDFKPAMKDKNNLTRCGIFRGKISQRETQTNKNRLEERTLPAPNS